MRHTAYLPLMNQVVVHLITAPLYKPHFECNISNHAYCAKKICSHLFVSKTYKKQSQLKTKTLLLLPTVFALRLQIARNEKQARA